jgi:hypothetical protein
MIFFITKKDAAGATVDRDGSRNDWGNQGFDVNYSGLTIHFEDETDAAVMAGMILFRLGIDVPELREKAEAQARF